MATYSFPALGFDPAPGDPEAIDAVASDCQRCAADLAADADTLHRLAEHVDWQGDAATAFAAHPTQLHDDLLRASHAHGGAGSALSWYAEALREAQVRRCHHSLSKDHRRPRRLHRPCEGQAQPMTDTSHPRTREEVLTDLVSLNGDVLPIIRELSRFPWDSSEELVELTGARAADVLERYLSDDISSGELEAWADALEGREDVSYESGKEDAIKDLLFEFSNPDIMGPATADRARHWVARLRSPGT